MLGRVANGIFWMYRYLERAENTARLLAAGQRMALTRGGEAGAEEWRSLLTTLGLREQYEAHHQDYSTASVCDFVLRNPANPENVLSMMERARGNARACRSAITLEVWEAVNEGWMSLKQQLSRPVRESNLGVALGDIRRVSTLARGATHGSMLRNEIYVFARLGIYLERADNTARILDIKYYLLLPSLAYVGTALDTTQWDNVLRCLSGERAFAWLNAGRMDASSIADFVILDGRFPRSLAFCYATLRENADILARVYGEEGASQEMIRAMDTRLSGLTVDTILEKGLHQFLREFIGTNTQLGNAIAAQYRFVV